MSKEDKTKDWIEHIIGKEVIDYNIEPTLDTEGNVISYDIMIHPKQSLGHIEIPITITSTSELKQNMSKRIYKEWEDIYPLTLIQMRYGGKYVAINCEEDSGHIQDVNTEEVHYNLEGWLDENVSPCPYGVGATIMECMNNLLEAMNNKSY